LSVRRLACGYWKLRRDGDEVGERHVLVRVSALRNQETR
jgi:hypothetical protein